MTKQGLSNQDFVRLTSAIDEAAIVAITDAHGVITYVNKKFCKISQYSSEELIGKTHRIINSQYHPKEFFIDMWKTISSGKVWEGEIRNRAKGGHFYWVNTTIVPFSDATGKPEKYVAVRYEITERKEAEEKLKIYAKELESSNRELQDFASVAAHDLQEPLRKIQSFADRLVAKSRDMLSDESKDYLDRMQNAAQRMQNLINDLLGYSRVTTQAQPFHAVDLKQIFSNILSDLEVRIEQTKGRIEISELPTIEADRMQMNQLFQNLISNALKFHKPEEPALVQIEATLLDGRKHLLRGHHHDGELCQIAIKDNGIGFDEKYLDRIFTIFQRLHGRNEYEGTGIGLAICRKIVERHGGELTAKSAPGQGSTFIVTLPTTHTKGA